MITFCFLLYITKIKTITKTIMNSNCKNKTISNQKQNHYLNMFQFYKQKYSAKKNIDLNFKFDTNINKRGTKRKFSEAFL